MFWFHRLNLDEKSWSQVEVSNHYDASSSSSPWQPFLLPMRLSKSAATQRGVAWRGVARWIEKGDPILGTHSVFRIVRLLLKKKVVSTNDAVGLRNQRQSASPNQKRQSQQNFHYRSWSPSRPETRRGVVKWTLWRRKCFVPPVNDFPIIIVHRIAPSLFELSITIWERLYTIWECRADQPTTYLSDGITMWT